MFLEAFGTADAGPAWIRLTLGWVAIVHALLCARVIVQRAWFWWASREPAHPERTPTFSMVAYGLLTANIGRSALTRLPQDPPLAWVSIIFYTLALTAGTIAFAQIVVLTRRSTTTP